MEQKATPRFFERLDVRVNVAFNQSYIQYLFLKGLVSAGHTQPFGTGSTEPTNSPKADRNPDHIAIGKTVMRFDNG